EEKELQNGGKGIVSYAPLGVIYGIQPWNFPAYQVVRYAIVNLMAGNGVILKHAENVTGSALKLQEIFEEAGLPKNLFTVIIVEHEVSDKIIAHDLVRGVTFTGSAGAGRTIAEQAGKNIKKSVMELGSNDAYIVLEDADVELAVKTCVNGRIYNNGETCVAAKRFVVVEAVYDQFKKGFVERMSAIRLGDPTKDDTQLGPMARKDLRAKIHEQVEESIKKGAEVLCGGKLPDGDGFYYPATVLGNVKPGQPAYDDELFGPVASLIKAKDQDDAMRIANDSRFGLGGGIFSKDEDKAIKLAQDHFDTGMVYINSFGTAQVDMPFGGVKNSGYGNEHGGFGIKEFVNAKAINILK
ncbi:MAG: aldehyde dehydrogenase family protein, partial [Nonlabens sp.]|nr:aldehyde dehydrogenase family protein [Nonlabens sp.]